MRRERRETLRLIKDSRSLRNVVPQMSDDELPGVAEDAHEAIFQHGETPPPSIMGAHGNQDLALQVLDLASVPDGPEPE